MRQFVSIVLAFSFLASPVLAGRSVLLVTPAGVYRAEVTNGVPGPWVAQEIDVIVQDFGPGVPIPPDPIPPADADVVKVAAISKGLKDKGEATACAALVDALSKLGLSGAKFKEAMDMAAPIADTSLQASGRITKWAKDCLAVTLDTAKLKAGLIAAWNVSPATLEAVYDTALQPAGTALPAGLEAEAFDLAAIIAIIQMIIQLLKNLGIIPA